MGQTRATDPEGRFTLVPPEGWSAAPAEEEGGLEVWREDGIGTLHLISFPADDEPVDPAEELYAFLAEGGVELEEDEVEDLPLDAGQLALCEYETEDEDDGEITFWLSGVATAPRVLVFATYVCPAGEEDAERDLVRQALGTLQLGPRP